MKLPMGLAAFLCLAATPIFAGNRSGYLVDSKCYEIEEQNVNPGDMSYADRDKDMEIRHCSPNAKTKFFAVVPADWQSLRLDSVGNTKAAELVRKTGKRDYFPVMLIGEMNKATIKVESISIAK